MCRFGSRSWWAPVRRWHDTLWTFRVAHPFRGLIGRGSPLVGAARFLAVVDPGLGPLHGASAWTEELGGHSATSGSPNHSCVFQDSCPKPIMRTTVTGVSGPPASSDSGDRAGAGELTGADVARGEVVGVASRGRKECRYVGVAYTDDGDRAARVEVAALRRIDW